MKIPREIWMIILDWKNKTMKILVKKYIMGIVAVSESWFILKMGKYECSKIDCSEIMRTNARMNSIYMNLPIVEHPSLHIWLGKRQRSAHTWSKFSREMNPSMFMAKNTLYLMTIHDEFSDPFPK